MRTRVFLCAVLSGGLVVPAGALAGDDLSMTKKISVGGNSFSSQTLVKGSRERTSMNLGTGQETVTLRQCDLKRTLTVNYSAGSYMVRPDMDEGETSKAAAAAMLGGAPVAESGGTVTYTSTVRDTGERKQLFGYAARHLKVSVAATASPNSCSKTKQNYEIDGWYIDLKDQANCTHFSPYLKDLQGGCQDRILMKQTGKARTGFPVIETITMTNSSDSPTVITSEVTELKKEELAEQLFDVPESFREVKTTAELYGMPPQAAPPQPAYQQAPANAQAMYAGQNAQAMMAAQQQAFAQAAQMGMTTGGMPGMGAPGPTGAAVMAPQALGPKAPGRIRIGVVTPLAQVGQGTNASQDYGTPIRNAMIQLMSGPAVEIAALDARIPVQIQAEAQQKQCDYILFSTVAVKKAKSGGLGGFMKMAAPVASMAPMMAGGMAGAAAASAASQVASVAAQQEATNQLGQFNGQIKSKDDISVNYQLTPTGQENPKVQNTLAAKAKADGEDVMTPLLTQLATTVITEAVKK